MNLSLSNKSAPVRLLPRAARRIPYARSMVGTVGALTTTLALAGHALAQTASSNGIGAQLQSTAQEGLTTGGFIAAAAMYVAAFICLIGGVWALWQSRNEQNRSPGKISMGAAGIVLCGLFATGPSWVNKASNSITGSSATVGTQAQAYQFTGN